SRRNANAAAGTERHDPTLELSVYGSGIDPSIFEVSPLVTTFEVVGDATNRFRVRQTALPQTKLNAGDTLVVAAPAMNSNKVPVVAEIPQLGRLFTKPEEETPRRVWLILMTPSIEPRKN
ncbi:MAG TPA: hypothetical protein VI282_06100, partial [Verrucomicrobiae bacterium]